MNTSSRSYTRSISRFRGVDFSVDDTSLSLNRFSNLQNMWKDWQSDDGPAVEAFPGYRILTSFKEEIYGLYLQRTAKEEYLLVHTGERLFRFPSAMRNEPSYLSSLSPIFSSLPKEEGCGFQSGDFFYLLIGGGLYRVDEKGNCLGLPDEETLPYTPTVFYNGEYYEQRNLLTNEVREVLTAEALEEASPQEYNDLVFLPLPSNPGCCAVKAGSTMSAPTALSIPSYAKIDGESYMVTGIAAGGFSGLSQLVSVSLPDTLTEIGAYAFSACISLSEIALPPGVRFIWHHAFAFCPFLRTVSLSENLLTVGEGAFMGDSGLSAVYYPMSEAAFGIISFKDASPFPESATVYYEATPIPSEKKLFVCPVYTPSLAIKELLLGDTVIPKEGMLLHGAHIHYAPLSTDGLVSSVCLLTSDPSVLSGRKVTLRLEASPSLFSTPVGFKAFGEGGLSLSGKDAVLGCRVVGQFDGRIFFTGNPRLPNTVFFSSPDETGYNNPLYIGNLNYFNDGLSSVPNRALLGTGDMLMVIKEDGALDGGIYFHSAESTGHSFAPRIYPATSGASGVGAIGGAVNFRDDPVFLTKNGLCAVERQAVNLERSLALRSHSVNLHLCRERLEKAKMAVFEGYLFVLCEGNLYLADSRETYRHPSGDMQYEWYFLSGVGDFVGDMPLYRFAEFLPKGAKAASIRLYSQSGAEVTTPVFSLMGETGEMLYYTELNGERYAVDHDGERRGGTLSPAVFLVAGEGALYFATRSGALGCFNTDKRGKALYRTLPSALYAQKGDSLVPLSSEGGAVVCEKTVSLLPLYEKENGEYRALGEHPVHKDGGHLVLASLLEEGVEGRIPAFYYSFAQHRYPVGCATAKDEGGIPNLRKNTLSGTVALRLKLLGPTRLSVLARTDRSGWHEVDLLAADAADFSDTDFSAFSFSSDTAVSLPVKEKERAWCEKQMALFEEVFRSPFGVYGLSYSFGPAGKLHQVL